LRWSDARKAWFAVAWAKRSGLRVIENDLRAFRVGTRSLRLLVGVDLHGGTVEGLQLALALFTEVRVYHDANTNPRRTFHPKLYVVEAPQRARAIIGSGNLTAGGLRTNYELAFRLDLDLSTPAERTVLEDLRMWFNARWLQPEATVRLTTPSIQALRSDPDVAVVPERWGPPRPSSQQVSSRGKKPKPLFRAVRGLAAPERQPNTDPADQIDSAPPDERIEAPFLGDDSLVLVAGLPKDRPGQAGFNRHLATRFFGVSKNGDPITIQAVRRSGLVGAPEISNYVNPTGSNGNNRFEMRDPEGRARTPGTFPILLVHRVGPGLFRYCYVLPSDTGYRAMDRERARREGVGTSFKPETKRVYLTLGELRARWPGCPLVNVADASVSS
jgi:HKD family nuclease